jgi:4-diphosphocytidyl-2-C-methyl-D-erythritol kinase
LINYIEIKAPAKINIGLNILSKRNDGYHNLSTLFYPIDDLYDTLTFRPSNRFEFICNETTIPQDDSNIVVKAKQLLELTCGKSINVKITLEKRIPSQAGLGGGSSDAAATLISLNEMFKLNLKHDQLIHLALLLGSDVPFFIKAKPAIGTSRGEILECIDLEIKEPIVLINPKINISTKEAYQNIIPAEVQFDYHDLIKDGKFDLITAKNILKNDFEQYVFKCYTEIGDLKQSLYDSGALFSGLSGSGSTVFGIFPNFEEAAVAAKIFSNRYFIFINNPNV